MKKPSSMTAVLGRTCPICFSMIDPVWYGYHISKCPSSNKVVSTLKQDMAPGTPIKNEAADDSQEAVMRVPSLKEAFVSLPADCTPQLSSDSQIAKERVGDRLPSIEAMQKQEVHQLRGEKQLLTDKVKSLELKLEELQFQLKLSKEAEIRALNLVESLRDTLKEKNLQASKAGLHSQLMGTSIDEPKSQVVIEHLGAGGIEHVGAEVVVKDKVSCHKYVDVVDLDDCPYHLKGKAIDSAKNDDTDKKLDLDHIVDLACGEGSMSQEFFSNVDGFIKSKVAIVSTSRKQRILQGASIIEDDNQDTAEKSCNPDSAKLGVEILVNLRNGSSATDVPHENNRCTPHTSEAFVIAIDEDVRSLSTAPSDVLGASYVGENVNNMGCSNSLQADRHGAAIVNGDSASKMRDCSLEVGVNGPAIEMQVDGRFTSHTSEPFVITIDEEMRSMSSAGRDVLGASCVGKNVNPIDCSNGLQTDGHVDSAGKMTSCSPVNRPALEMQVDTGIQESDINAQQIMETQSCSSSLNANVVRAKPGIRRMVLQSDSESESGKIQDIHTGKRKSHICNSKGPLMPALSSEAVGEKTNVESRAKSMRTSEKKISQPPSQRSKRSKVMHSSDQSDYVTCEGESEESSHRSAQSPVIAAADLEGAGADGITDGEHTGVRRSKRLREMSKNNFQNMPLSKKSISVVQLSSSCAEAIEESEVFKSDASGSSHSMAFGTHVKRRGSLRTRKRLFEEVESLPIFGKNNSTDSETDDSKIDSDADSLDGFITESEGREYSRSSCEDHSSSSSYSSSLDVYLNHRHKRDLKIKNYVWELEGEMLYVLAIDPKLCLRAVCALNRRQTEDEQAEKVSKYSNRRGFDKLHAARGSRIADFLTDGDPSGPVKKSIEDLEKFDAGALEFCKMLASKHSKQLFEMYTNAEDPHFPFS